MVTKRMTKSLHSISRLADGVKAQKARSSKRSSDTPCVRGRCLCGAIEVEIDVPAFWAWHDHSVESRKVHAAAYATYVGCWLSRFRVAKGLSSVTRFDDQTGKSTRAFCGHCGTPVYFARRHSPKMVNVPRALFNGRTGREPRYHVAMDQQPEWAYRGEAVRPLKGYPGVMVESSRRNKSVALDDWL